jgi:hypothetical protein
MTQSHHPPASEKPVPVSDPGLVFTAGASLAMFLLCILIASFAAWVRPS